MPRERGDLLKDLMDSVFLMDEELAVKAAKEVVEAGYDVYDAINNGLVAGMNKAGVLYEKEEYFVPELLICSDAMYAGLDILRPHLKIDEAAEKHKVVIGVMEGDTHDIGKNLVKIMMESAGFNVIDLGRDVKLDRFVEAAEIEKADAICMSTLMTTTMPGMKSVIDSLNEKNIRDKYKVMIGGGPVSQKFADTIGADIYTVDANSAVRRLKEVLNYEG